MSADRCVCIDGRSKLIEMDKDIEMFVDEREGEDDVDVDVDASESRVKFS